MKILGETDFGFIIDIKRNELAIMLGHNSYSDLREASSLSIGHEFNWDKTGTIMTNVRSLDKNKIRHIRGQLTQALDLIDGVQDGLDALALFDKLSQCDSGS